MTSRLQLLNPRLHSSTNSPDSKFKPVVPDDELRLHAAAALSIAPSSVGPSSRCQGRPWGCPADTQRTAHSDVTARGRGDLDPGPSPGFNVDPALFLCRRRGREFSCCVFPFRGQKSARALGADDRCLRTLILGDGDQYRRAV